MKNLNCHPPQKNPGYATDCGNSTDEKGCGDSDTQLQLRSPRENDNYFYLNYYIFLSILSCGIVLQIE